jgi:hypothetical protein
VFDPKLLSQPASKAVVDYGDHGRMTDAQSEHLGFAGAELVTLQGVDRGTGGTLDQYPLDRADIGKRDADRSTRVQLGDYGGRNEDAVGQLGQDFESADLMEVL